MTWGFSDLSSKIKYDTETASSSSSSSSSETANYSINDLIQLGAFAAQKSWEGYPGYEALQEFIPYYLGKLREQMETRSTPYTGQLTIGTPEDEADILDILRSRLTDPQRITAPPSDLAGAYAGAEERVLPQFRKSWEETVSKPAQERLDAMGVKGRPALDVMSSIGEDQSLQEAGVVQQIGERRADALERQWTDTTSWELRNMGLEQANLQALWEYGARPEERERRNIGTNYNEWLRMRGEPARNLQLGAPIYGQTLGTMSDVYTTGLNMGGTLANTQLGGQLDLAQTKWESNFIAPYLAASSQPIQTSNTGLCIVATTCYGDRNAYEVNLTRRYRDEYMTPTVFRGYYMLADWLVPLMQRKRLVFSLVKKLIITNLVKYLEALFNHKKAPIHSRIIARLFERLCRKLGQRCRHYIRSNGERC